MSDGTGKIILGSDRAFISNLSLKHNIWNKVDIGGSHKESRGAQVVSFVLIPTFSMEVEVVVFAIAISPRLLSIELEG